MAYLVGGLPLGRQKLGNPADTFYGCPVVMTSSLGAQQRQTMASVRELTIVSYLASLLCFASRVYSPAHSGGCTPSHTPRLNMYGPVIDMLRVHSCMWLVVPCALESNHWCVPVQKRRPARSKRYHLCDISVEANAFASIITIAAKHNQARTVRWRSCVPGGPPWQDVAVAIGGFPIFKTGLV